MKSNLSHFLLPVVLLAAACSKDADAPRAPHEQEGEAVEIVFSAGMGTPAAEADDTNGDPIDTRTIYTHTGTGLQATWKGSDTYPADYDRVGIVVTAVGSTQMIEGSDNIPYKVLQSGKISSLEADGTPLSGLVRGQTYRFLSYYPYDAAQSFTKQGYELYYFFNRAGQRGQIQAAPNDMSHLPNLMLMCAEPVTVRIPEEGVPVVDFSYKHSESTLQIKITNQRDEPVAIKKIGIKGDKWSVLLSKALYNNLNSTSEDAMQNLTVTSPAALAKGDEAQSFWLSINKQSRAYIDYPIQFSIDTDKGTFVLTKKLPAEGILIGKNYVLNISIPQTPGEGETWTPAS